MGLYDATFAMVDALEKEGIDYVLVGGMAVIYYGVGRSTMDADFVVQFAGRKLDGVLRHLGSGFALTAQKSFEVFTLNERREFQVVGTPFKIELFSLSEDAFDQEQFARRIRVTIEGRGVWMQAAEDLVIQKLRWQRPKDVGDALDVIGMRSHDLDWAYIERWCDAHGTRELLDNLRRKIPPL